MLALAPRTSDGIGEKLLDGGGGRLAQIEGLSASLAVEEDGSESCRLTGGIQPRCGPGWRVRL